MVDINIIEYYLCNNLIYLVSCFYKIIAKLMYVIYFQITVNFY